MDFEITDSTRKLERLADFAMLSLQAVSLTEGEPTGVISALFTVSYPTRVFTVEFKLTRFSIPLSVVETLTHHGWQNCAAMRATFCKFPQSI